MEPPVASGPREACKEAQGLLGNAGPPGRLGRSKQSPRERGTAGEGLRTQLKSHALIPHSAWKILTTC